MYIICHMLKIDSKAPYQHKNDFDGGQLDFTGAFPG